MASHGGKGSAPRRIRRTDVGSDDRYVERPEKRSGASLAIGIAVVIVGHRVSSFFDLFGMGFRINAPKQKALILTLEDEGLISRRGTTTIRP